jgi:hypothetical protein
MAEGRTKCESVPLEAHGERTASEGRLHPVGILEVPTGRRRPPYTNRRDVNGPRPSVRIIRSG